MTAHEHGLRAEVALLLALAVLVVDLGLVRGPEATLFPFAPSAVLPVRLSMGLGVLLGYLWPTPRLHGTERLVRGMLGIGAMAGLAGFAWSYGFVHGGAYLVAAGGVPLVLGLAAGFTTRGLLTWGRTQRTHRSLRFLIDPLFLLLTLTLIAGLGYLTGLLGLLRQGLVITALSATLALLFDDRPWHWHPGTVGLFALPALVVAAEAAIPIGLVTSSVHTVLSSVPTTYAWLHVASGQGSLHLFYNGRLRTSTIDERRWAETLVRPALGRVAAPRRALALSVGEGLIERELLADPAKLAVTSVVRDLQVVEHLRRSHAWNEIVRGAHTSPRVTWIEADPLVWLNQEKPSELVRFDVIVVDLPDPSGPLESKYYTRHFARRLLHHLTEQGVVAIQATSPRHSPRAFSTFRHTLSDAGFATMALRVPLITMGEWGILLGARTTDFSLRRPSVLAHTFPGDARTEIENLPADTLPHADFSPEVATLPNPLVHHFFCLEGPNGEC